MNFKKILLAVDASENAMRAVDYVGGVIGGGSGFEVRLLCIEMLPSRDIYPDEEQWKEACVRTRSQLKAFLAEASGRLVALGVERSVVDEQYMVSCRSPFADGEPACSRGTGVAQEILENLRAGDFGTVVVGRRGVSKAEEFLFGSVSNKIVHSVRDCTVWVVS
jgi:nucleotide-binding universal stress UspA family protein